jgi:hypothetical protein
MSIQRTGNLPTLALKLVIAYDPDFPGNFVSIIIIIIITILILILSFKYVKSYA